MDTSPTALAVVSARVVELSHLLLKIRDLGSLWRIILSIGGVWLINYVLQQYLAVRRAQGALGNCPGHVISWVHPFDTGSLVLAEVKQIYHSDVGSFFAGWEAYRKLGSTLISSVTFGGAVPTFWTSDAEIFKQVSADRQTFPKYTEAYERVGMYGPHIVGLEGSEWKRHRDIVRSAFGESNVALVWEQMARIINDWFTLLDTEERDNFDRIEIDTLYSFYHISLLVIAAAGFGDIPNLLAERSQRDDGEGKGEPFYLTLNSALTHFITKLGAPRFLYSIAKVIYIPFLSKELRETDRAYDGVEEYLQKVISAERSSFDSKRSTSEAALARAMIEANLQYEALGEKMTGKTLTDRELISNTFVFLVAGHETSSHTLTFATLLLSLYPEIQEKLYKETVALWPQGVPKPGATQTFKDAFPQLEYTYAVFQETLRLFAPVPRVAKRVTADTWLTAQTFAPGSNNEDLTPENTTPTRFLVPKDSLMVLEMAAVHMNPLHWGPDPTEFRPERFIDTDTYKHPKDAFVAFSKGARACIGNRFAIAESVFVLAALVRRYELIPPSAVDGMSFEDKKAYMVKWKALLTATPSHPRARLRERTN